jgi:hypothetical protein
MIHARNSAAQRFEQFPVSRRAQDGGGPRANACFCASTELEPTSAARPTGRTAGLRTAHRRFGSGLGWRPRRDLRSRTGLADCRDGPPCRFVLLGGVRDRRSFASGYVGVSLAAGTTVPLLRWTLAVEVTPGTAVRLPRRSPQGVDAVPPQVLGPPGSRPASLPRHPASGLVACAMALVLVACDPFGGKNPLAGPRPDMGAPLVVHIQNSTSADFYAAGSLVWTGGNIRHRARRN